jgi:hypothetical protein
MRAFMLGDRLLRALHHALIFLLVVGSMVALSAQAVLDPRYVEFDASDDHNVVTGGVPVVARYSLSIYPVGSTVAFATVDLGKPTPDSSGVIRVDFLPLLSALPTPGVSYEARVAALGPGGSAASAASNGFSFSPTCTPQISPTTRLVGQTGATGGVAVSLAAGCTWSAVSNAGWITLTGTTAGNGTGSVPYSVAVNTTTSQRVGTATIAGQTFTVTQAAGTCTYSISPTSQTVAANGGNASTTVTASGGTCDWTAASNNSWLTVTSGASGTGNGTVTFRASPNAGSAQRTGTLTIAGRTFTVTQPGNNCTYVITPLTRNVLSRAGSSSTYVTTTSTCAWEGSTTATWITITSDGPGSGAMTYTFTANPGSQPRTATINVATQVHTVTQAGSVPPTSPSNLRIVSVGGQ